MRPLFDSMEEYYKAGKVSAGFRSVEATVGREDLITICIELLAWLRRQAVYKNKRGLDLSADFPWGKKLIGLIQTEPIFRDSLVVEDGIANFNPDISEAERAELRDWGRKIFNPPMMK
jgi:hypothetical protein